MKISFSTFSILLIMSVSTYAQNLQQYTPSVMLSQGQSQWKLFNSLYTQNKVRDANGNIVHLDERQTFLNHSGTFLYGLSKSGWLNVGMEINVTSAWYPDYNATFVASVGPSIKILPLKNVNRLSIQSTFLFPVEGEKLENPRFVNHNRYTWFTQIFYDKSFSEQFNIFLEADLLYRFKAVEEQDDFFRVPLSAILSYFPDQKWTAYVQLQHAAAYGTLRGINVEKFGRISWFTQLTAGVKYQMSPMLELEFSTGSFLWSKNDGAGNTINLGVRFLK